MKTCTRCKREQPREAFYRDARAGDGLNPHCKTCRKTYASSRVEYQREAGARYRARHPERVHAFERASRLKRMYGITADEFAGLERQQDGKCAICGVTPAGNLVVDHDHDDNHVRGLLCNNCNSGIGKLRDDPRIVMAAWRYLQEDRELGVLQADLAAL